MTSNNSCYGGLDVRAADWPTRGLISAVFWSYPDSLGTAWQQILRCWISADAM